ncbi:MAG: U32 family peptidase [Candidatus Omnitrophica bacterium]|nr:U32 family peptidase [Candidatus Omnitrophota bacterium]
MEFSVPADGNSKIISGLPSKNATGEIREVYGNFLISDAIRDEAQETERHIGSLRGEGFRFNYLLDALCLDNLEFSRKGQKRLRRLLDRLVEMKINSVTVGNLYLVIWIKKNYPSMSITVSEMANVDSLNRAKFWENLGVDKIAFPGPAVNRNFSLIRQLRGSLKCKIQLVANNACVCNCPVYINHSLITSHSSRGLRDKEEKVFDHNLSMCKLRRLERPVNFIRADWIRPEDVSFYEKLGVDSIKLSGGDAPSDIILKIINAYILRHHHGNLVELFCFSYTMPGSMRIFIDNQALDGFLEGMPRECDLTSCSKCGYCQMTASHALKIDKGIL